MLPSTQAVGLALRASSAFLLCAVSALPAQSNPAAPAVLDAPPTMAAVRSAEPISVDGRLEEASWRAAAAIPPRNGRFGPERSP